MAYNVQFGGRFRNLVNYPEWTDSKIGDLACAVDWANITAIRSNFEHALQDMNVRPDFRNWLSSDVLHIRHTLENLHSAVCASTLSELSMAIDLWHERLIASLRTQWDSPVLCCGPGAVEDNVLPADEFLRLFTTDGLEKAASVRSPNDAVKDKADVIALLWRAAEQPGQGLKPFLDDPQLRKEFEDVFNSFDSPPKSQMLGGAQAIMASANCRIGVQADVAWPYHPRRVADYGYEKPMQSVRRVVVKDGKNVKPLDFFSPDLRRPHRQSYILNITDGMDIAGVRAVGSDRVIFRMRRYCTNDWNLHEATLECSGGSRVCKPSGWDPQEWPSLPLIGDVSVKRIGGQDLAMIYKPAGDEALRALTQTYRRFIWTGLQALDDPGLDQHVRQTLTSEIAHQFELLSKAGAQIYIEISGVPVFPEVMKDIVANKATCLGINQTELLRLTSRESGRTNPTWVWPNPTEHPESLLARYWRGVHLAQYMETDVFIHGNECSLYITHSHDEIRLNKIVSIILTAQLAVISHLLERAGAYPDVGQPSLAEKGFMSLLQFAYDFVHSHAAPDLLGRIVQTGYFCARDDSEFSFAVVPVLWPEEVQQVNPTGAGDTVAGVAAALLPTR